MAKRIIVVLVLLVIVSAAIATAAYARRLLVAQSLYYGQVVDAQAFEDGSMLVLQTDLSGQRLWVQYYNVQGIEILVETIDLRPGVESVIWQACGGYVQIVTGYADYGQRFVMTVDEMPQTCVERVFLPLVTR